MKNVGADKILRPGFFHEACLAAVYPGRFVAKDMQSALHGRDTLLFVEPVRGGDNDRVQPEVFIIHGME